MTGKEPGRKKPDVLAMIKKAVADTDVVLARRILAPVISGSKVRVKITELIHELEVDDSQYEGWAVLKATDLHRATVIEPASAAQVKAYLSLLPRFHLISLLEQESHWWGIPAQTSDSRLQISAAVPIHLCQRVGSFQTIAARFDGTTFWFEEVSRRRNPVIARKLRDALAAGILPEDLKLAEIVPQERAAYAMVFFATHPELIDQPTPPVVPDDANSEQDNLREPHEQTFDYRMWWSGMRASRLSAAIEHAGARLDAYWTGDNDTTTVRMLIDGEAHVVTVSKTLTVRSAGICLSGLDSDFDLTSLVGVLREHKRLEG